MSALSSLLLVGIYIALIVSAKKRKQQRRNASARPAAPKQSPFDMFPETEDQAKETGARLERDRKMNAAEAASTPKTAGTHPARAASAPEGEGSSVRNEAHTVRPSFEPGAHAHEETSMTGFTPCPPGSVPARKPVKKREPAQKPASAPVSAPVSAPAPAAALSFAFTKEDTLRAILYSEILSKPKALR